MIKNIEVKLSGLVQKKEYTEKSGLFAWAFSNTPVEYKIEDDYIIYIVNNHCDNSSYCNHGDFLFVAFNDNTIELIYKSKEW